jgi:hypothetical protein
MMADTELAVNSVVYKEEEEEGYVNLTKGKQWQGNEDGWWTPDNSWLEREQEEGIMQVYHVTVILEEDDDEEGMSSEEEEGQTSQEKMQPAERKRGFDRGGCGARRRRPKRKRICKEEVD